MFCICRYKQNQAIFGAWHGKYVWKVKILFKVACLCWLVIKEAILTQDNMRKGHVFSGQCDRKGINSSQQTIKMNYLFLFHFWCKEGVDDVELLNITGTSQYF